VKIDRFRRLLDVTVAEAVGTKILPPRSALAAIDSTGLEAHHTSHYFVKRRAKGGRSWQKTTYRRFPKLAVVCACRSHFILSAVTIRGPSLDITHLERAAVDAVFRHRFGTLLADAGYDAEWAHHLLRLELSVRSIIPPLIGRQTTKLPTGYYRRLMRTRFAKKTYGQRWQVETVYSMIKRRQGDSLSAHTVHSQNRVMRLMVIAHNIMILRHTYRVFYRAPDTPSTEQEERLLISRSAIESSERPTAVVGHYLGNPRLQLHAGGLCLPRRSISVRISVLLTFVLLT